MKIYANHLTLRFYASDGWTAEKVGNYLIDPRYTAVTYRPDLKYFSVYDNSGHGVFKKELLENEINNPSNFDMKWYIGK